MTSAHRACRTSWSPSRITRSWLRRRRLLASAPTWWCRFPYGDSGKTTFFIDNETGWKRHSRDIRGNEVKVMKRIDDRTVRSLSKRLLHP